MDKLAIIDLYSRFPYEPYYLINGDDKPRKILRYRYDDNDGFLLDFMADKNAPYPIIQVYASEVKPYLRTMSSMTKEEVEEFSSVVFESQGIEGVSASTYVSDWLISKHFDVRGLIPKGLAIEAPEGMYSIK